MRIAEAVLAACLLAPCAGFAHDVRGDWMTEDKRGIIRFAPCGDALCGTIVGISDWPTDGSVLRDIHGAPQCHLAIVTGLHPGRDGRLHGTVTNPEDGRAYAAQVWVPEDGVLRLRGYVALPILGSTQLWPPFAGTIQPDCHFRKAH